MIVTKELASKILELEYPISLVDFIRFIKSNNGGGSKTAICVAVNCHFRGRKLDYRIKYIENMVYIVEHEVVC